MFKSKSVERSFYECAYSSTLFFIGVTSFAVSFDCGFSLAVSFILLQLLEIQRIKDECRSANFFTYSIIARESNLHTLFQLGFSSLTIDGSLVSIVFWLWLGLSLFWVQFFSLWFMGSVCGGPEGFCLFSQTKLRGHRIGKNGLCKCSPCGFFTPQNSIQA